MSIAPLGAAGAVPPPDDPPAVGPAAPPAPARPQPAPPPPPAATGVWRDFDSFLDGLPNTPKAVDGNNVALLVDGPSAFPPMLAGIEGARSSIEFETYQFFGQAATDFADAFMKKAAEGVKVRLIIDADSVKWNAPTIARLEAFAKTNPNLEIAINEENKVAGIVGTAQQGKGGTALLDHRKGLILDGKTAFMGGMNVTDEERTAAWHDMHARVDGPAVADLRSIFLRRWQAMRPGAPVPAVERPPAATPAGDPGANVRMIAHTPGEDENIRRMYVKAIDTAQRTIRIEDPFFDDPAVMNALCAAARRGVAVQCVWPAKNDQTIAQQAARSWYPKLLEAGVGVYEYRDRMAHEKVAAFDGKVATIGSSNLDPLSLSGDLEHNLVAIDRDGRPGFARTLDQTIQSDIAQHADRIWHVLWDPGTAPAPPPADWDSSDQMEGFAPPEGRIVAVNVNGEIVDDGVAVDRARLREYDGTDWKIENLVEPHGPPASGGAPAGSAGDDWGGIT